MSDDKKPIDEPVQSPSAAAATPESGEVGVEQLKAMIGIPRLAQDAQTMVRQALDAFVRGDGNLAREVIAMDDSVDQQTEQSFRELLTYMLEDPRNISRAIRLAFIGKYFERMADGATNVCVMVVYLVEGKMIKHATGLLHNG